MVEEYNHGKEFPKLKGLRFMRRAAPGESSKSLPGQVFCPTAGSPKL